MFEKKLCAKTRFLVKFTGFNQMKTMRKILLSKNKS